MSRGPHLGVVGCPDPFDDSPPQGSGCPYSEEYLAHRAIPNSTKACRECQAIRRIFFAVPWNFSCALSLFPPPESADKRGGEVCHGGMIHCPKSPPPPAEPESVLSYLYSKQRLGQNPESIGSADLEDGGPGYACEGDAHEDQRAEKS